MKINILGSAEGQVGFKIGPKMGPKTECQIRCILTSIFDRFWSILGPKLGWEMELESIKNRYHLRKTNSGVQVENKNRSQIDQKKEFNMGRHLGIDFHRFWWILGSNLGGKIEPRSTKNGIEKTTEKRKAPWYRRNWKQCLRHPPTGMHCRMSWFGRHSDLT